MELTITDLYNDIKKQNPNDSIRSLCEKTLSLWTMGMFDAIEGQVRETSINNLAVKMGVTV